jgi:hypothetical protein
VAAEVAILEAPGKNVVERRAGDDPQVAQARDGLREPPIRDGDTHAALDDLRKIRHALI